MKKQVDNVHTHIDLFSGIGGFALAARWAGIETIQFVEIEPFCQKVLQKNFPGVPIHDDIKTFKSDRFKNVGLITGGYPCQPFSVAGKRKGEEDDRHLWPKMFEIIQAKQPNWIICENVYGHVSMGLDEVLTDLENEAYACQTFIVPACAKNAPHRRDRLWICAHSINGSDRTIGGQVSKKNGIQGINREKVGSGLSSRTDSDAPDTAGSSNRPERRICEGSQYSESSRIPVWDEPWLEVAARLCRVDDGVPNRVDRLKSLGNAIVPQIAYEIGMAIIATENEWETKKESANEKS